MQLSTRGLQRAILVTGIIVLGMFVAQGVHAYTVPPWKWVVLPSCAGNGAKIGIRVYITPFPYPNTINDNLVVEILNPGNTEQNITMHLYLPKDWAPRSVNRSLTLIHGLNRITIEGVNTPPGAEPGTEQLLILFERACSSGSSWRSAYLPITLYPKPRLRLSLISTKWGDGYAYPGLRGETLTIELRNDEPYYIAGYTITVNLPNGISLSGSNATTYTITRRDTNIRPGDIIAIRIPVDIGYNATQGNKTIILRISALIRYENTLTELNTNIRAPISVTQIPGLQYKVVQKGWLTGAAYPGEKGARLLLDLVNIDKFTITNAYIAIVLPKGITSNHKQTQIITLSDTAIGYGDHLSLSLSTDIDNDVKPGTYYAEVNALLYGTEPSGARGLREFTLLIPLRILPKASINMSLLYLNWSDGYAYPGEINTGLSMVFRSLDKATINNIVLNITLPRLGITKLLAINQGLGFGDVLDVTTHITLPKGVKPGDYEVDVVFQGIVSMDGQEYLGLARFSGVLHIRDKHTESLRIVSVRWRNLSIGNETFYASPQLLVEYWGSDRVKVMVLTISNITNAEIRGNLSNATIVYDRVLTAGDVASILLPPLRVIDSLKPVSFTVTINATLNTPSGGVYTVAYKRRVEIPVAVESSALRVASVEYVTKHLLPGARGAEISIRIANVAPEPVYVLGVSFLNKEFNISVAQTDCFTTPLPPGQACTLTLRISIPSSTAPGMHEIGLRLWYSYQRGTDTITSYQVLRAKILIESLEKYEPELELSAAWALAPGAEPIVVLPGDIAPLQITVYNKGPTSAKGLAIEIGSSKIGKVLESTYSCNSLPVGASCNIQLYIRIRNDVQPGRYVISVNLTYIFDSYTVYKVVQKKYNIRLEIGDERDAVKAFYLYWLTPPRPGTRDAQLAIYLLEDPRMVSAIKTVEILLPSGFFNPENNSRRVLAVPAESTLPVTQFKQLYELGAKLLQSRLVGNQFLGPRIFVAKIGISQGVRGVHQALVTVYWVDKLGSLRRTSYTVALPFVGGTRYIKIVSPNTAVLHGGIANISLKLINIGTAPLYNVYVLLIPTTYTAYPNETTKYIQEMLPGHEYTITYSLNYNPSSFGQQSSYTFSGIISVLYETPTGLYGYYNTSISIILKPPIELHLGSLQAEWRNGSLIVEGVISNTGTEQAKTVSVIIVAGNSSAETLIGDIDAGSESPFRISLKAPYTDKILVKLVYHDSYGASYSLARTLSVKKVISVSTPRKESGASIGRTLKYIVLLLIILAALSTIYFYKILRRSQAMEGYS